MTRIFYIPYVSICKKKQKKMFVAPNNAIWKLKFFLENSSRSMSIVLALAFKHIPSDSFWNLNTHLSHHNFRMTTSWKWNFYLDYATRSWSCGISSALAIADLIRTCTNVFKYFYYTWLIVCEPFFNLDLCN